VRVIGSYKNNFKLVEQHSIFLTFLDHPRGYLGKLKLAIDPIPRGRPIGNLRSDKGPVGSGIIRVTTYKFRVFGGADSTAPSRGRARHRDPAPQHYFFRCVPESGKYIVHTK